MKKHEILISFFPWNYWTISSHDLEVGCIRKSNFGFSYVPNFKAFRWITSSSINLLLTKSLQVYHIVKLKLLVVTYCSREIDQNFFFFTKKNFFLTIWFCPKLFVFYYCSSRIHHFFVTFIDIFMKSENLRENPYIICFLYWIWQVLLGEKITFQQISKFYLE